MPCYDERNDRNYKAPEDKQREKLNFTNSFAAGLLCELLQAERAGTVREAKLQHQLDFWYADHRRLEKK